MKQNISAMDSLSLADVMRQSYYNCIAPSVKGIIEDYGINAPKHVEVASEDAFAMVLGGLAQFLCRFGSEKVIGDLSTRVEILKNAVQDVPLSGLKDSAVFQGDQVMLTLVATGSDVDMMQVKAGDILPVYAAILTIAKCLVDTSKASSLAK